MGANGYLQRRENRILVNKQAAADTEQQYSIDLLCLVLNDPDVMGKDVFGGKRLVRILRAYGEAHNEWATALTTRPEADYYRAKLDEKLQRIFGENFQPFEERYPWVASADIKKRR